MYTIADTKKWVSNLRRGVSFLLILAMAATLFSTVLAARADAASGYKVKTWTSGGMHCYTVYKGSLPPMYEPTFYRYDDDVYKSGNMKITFYWQYMGVTEAEAKAFYKYLGENSKASSWNCGYYGISDSDGYTSYYGYKIEGWRSDKNSIDRLLQSSPLINSDKTKLYIEYIGKGNLVNEKWSDIRKVRECSAAIYLPDNDATIAFRFIDRYGEPVFLYCP